MRTAGRGRRIEHSLTGDGRDALEQGTHVAIAALRNLFAPLDEPERMVLAHLMSKLLRDEESTLS